MLWGPILVSDLGRISLSRGVFARSHFCCVIVPEIRSNMCAFWVPVKVILEVVLVKETFSERKGRCSIFHVIPMVFIDFGIREKFDQRHHCLSLCFRSLEMRRRSEACFLIDFGSVWGLVLESV